MKFSTKEDIEVPIDHVFAQVSDFPYFERTALRRGAEMQRVDDLTAIGPGMAWDVAFELRGKRRELELELTRYDPPNSLVMSSRSASLGGYLLVDLIALSRGRTRLSIDIELLPQNLSARLLVQSLKQARGNLYKRFNLRVAEYAKDMEDRLKRPV